MRRWERRLRTWSGLVLAVFVTFHLVNHATGLVSLSAMEQVRGVLAGAWRSPPGTLLLYSALVVHFALALWSLYRRTTLRLPLWESAQLWLGLSIVPLLSGHIVATRTNWSVFGNPVGYESVIAGLVAQPWLWSKQSILLFIVWTHLLLGLHYWLRLRNGYRKALPLLYPLAVLLPVLAWLGFARISAQLDTLSGPTGRQAFPSIGDIAMMTTLGLIVATLVARQVRRLARKTLRGYRLHHANGRTIAAMPGRSILEAVRSAGIPHASVCGGRARCTTCRVRVGDGLDALPPPNKLEREALDRIEAAPNVRLACQTRPQQDVQIMPLLAVDTSAGDHRQGGMQGRERRITALFIDLRGSTLLGEQKLPYDVLFILNRFFAEMAAALTATTGHYAQFNGDGLLALYGLKGKSADGCRAALAGAVLMQRNLERLNASLGSELENPLRVGIGIHHGPAIVGSMGPPQAPIVSAIGDTINIAARLEALTKDYACTLVVSADAWHRANLDPETFPQHDVQVRGKQKLLSVYAVDDLPRLEQLLNPEPAVDAGNA